VSGEAGREHARLDPAPPGALTPRFEEIPYTKLKRTYWPKVEDPFAADPIG
jgi:hypothetical protein